MSTETPARLPSLARMKGGDHYCGIFKTDTEQRDLVVEFIRLGVERHEKMLYLINVTTAVQLKSMLSAAGIDVDALVEKGQLVILTAKDTYLKDGAFEPQKMIDALGEQVELALAEGYTALRTTGEMTWALAGDPGSERLIEYEALLNHFYVKYPQCYSICQYDHRRFDAELLTDVLQTHPKMLVGTDGFDNQSMYYVPPDVFLSPERSTAVLDTWLENLRGAAGAQQH